MHRAKAIRCAELLGLEIVCSDKVTCSRPAPGLYVHVDDVIPEDHDYHAAISFVGEGGDRFIIPEHLDERGLTLLRTAYELMYRRQLQQLAHLIRDIVHIKCPDTIATRLSAKVDAIQTAIRRDGG